MDNVLAPGLFTAKLILFAYGRTTKLSTKIKARENKKEPFPQNIQPDTEVIRGFKIPWGMFQDKTQTTAMTEIVCVLFMLKFVVTCPFCNFAYVQALLQITGSRLCMAGGVEAVYIKTVQGVLIKVEPHTHIPKTLGPFCAMMCESSSVE